MVLITLDPGHFHAALVHKEMLAGVPPHVHVYAPLGPDLTAHLNRLAAFNARKENPTLWTASVYAGPDFFERMLDERRGDAVIISGRNHGKIQRIRDILSSRMHVLADKPWIIEPDELPDLQAALDAAERNGVVGYDIMTQRFEISWVLLKELVGDAGVFGGPLEGTVSEPSVSLESVHYLVKSVGGIPNVRPSWFFDIRQQGEGLTDVGTHLADRAQWTLFPTQHLRPDADVRVLSASRWPTPLSLDDFRRITGEKHLPGCLEETVKDDRIEYFCNGRVVYSLRGIHVKLEAKWDIEAKDGAGDTETGIYRGSRSTIEVRQGADENFRPELYVLPSPGQHAAVQRALQHKLASLERQYPGIALEDQGARSHVRIPDHYRLGHEAFFSLVLQAFLGYARNPDTLPAWERDFMLAKYYVTTRGVELARKSKH